MDSLLKQFHTPGAAWRGKPFWAWNGRLEEAELRRQIRVMREMGLGGFFMHSRVGLVTEYLSEEWMDLTRACIDEARKLGMEAWLYDEDRWPSGAAGGIVTRDPRYRQKRLQLTLAAEIPADRGDDVLGVWTGIVEDDCVRDLAPAPAGGDTPAPPPGASALVFRVVEAPHTAWYNGFTYLDTLSHEAVRRYIEVTHDAYLREVGEHFSSTVPGIFTDEPNHGLTCSEWDVDQASTRSNEIPWTPRLPEVFRDRYGYDLLPHLPELFLEVDGVALSKARYDYHDCKTFLFVNAFARQIGQWCGDHGIAMTGHVLEEAKPSTQTNVVGSAMRFYEHMQAPGIDVLTEPNREYDTARQCASVARQTGCTWILSETYGCTGWDFPFEGHKAVGDWQAALGVNLRCQHLSWYTMAGQAKRDYPASIHFHSPWWRDYPVVEDYFARIGVLMTRGRPVRRLLVVHPIESTWIRCRIGYRHRDDVRELDDRLERLRDALLEAAVDFDYGDEEMLGRLAAVEDGSDGPILRFGEADYDCVLVPRLLTIRSTTLDLLERYLGAGGSVVFAGDPPAAVDAEASGRAAEVAAAAVRVDGDPDRVAEIVAPLARYLTVRTADGAPFRHALTQLRRDGDRRYLLVVNTDRSRGYPGVTIEIDAMDAEEWDPATGDRFRALSLPGDHGRLRIRTDLPASGSRLFVLLPEPSSLAVAPRFGESDHVAVGDGPWPITRDEPNALVLDRPAWRIDDGDWNESDEILRIDTAARRHLGLEPRGGAMLQPWARDRSERGPFCTVRLRYEFEVETAPAGSVALAVEQPDRVEIHLDDQSVEPEPAPGDGWWVDPCLRTLAMPDLQPGPHRLEFTVRFDEDADLEAAFLLGEFGVRLDGTRATIIAGPDRLTAGDWVSRGLPFYSSTVTYRLTAELGELDGNRAVLVLPRWKGACARVRVNDRPCRTIAWQPYESDVTAAAVPGTNRIEIDLVSSRHNAFGPLHQRAPEPPWVGSNNFTTEGTQWQDEYQLRPCGILEAPYLSVRSAQRAD